MPHISPRYIIQFFLLLANESIEHDCSLNALKYGRCISSKKKPTLNNDFSTVNNVWHPLLCVLSALHFTRPHEFNGAVQIPAFQCSNCCSDFGLFDRPSHALAQLIQAGIHSHHKHGM